MPKRTPSVSGSTGDDPRVHTCHVDCPCQHGGQAAPDFVGTEDMLAALTDEQREALTARINDAIDFALDDPYLSDRGAMGTRATAAVMDVLFPKPAKSPVTGERWTCSSCGASISWEPPGQIHAHRCNR